MKTSLTWGKGRSTSKASAPPSKAKRAARKIRWCVAVDQAKAGAAAREAHLRSLMGLPTARSLIDDEGEGSE